MVTRKILIALQQFFVNTGLKQGRPACRQPGFFWVKDCSGRSDRERTFRAYWTANSLDLEYHAQPAFGTAWSSHAMTENQMLEWLRVQGTKAVMSRPEPAVAAPVSVPLKGQTYFVCIVNGLAATTSVQSLLRYDNEASLLSCLKSLGTAERATVFQLLPCGTMKPIKVEVETRLKFG